MNAETLRAPGRAPRRPHAALPLRLLPALALALPLHAQQPATPAPAPPAGPRTADATADDSDLPPVDDLPPPAASSASTSRPPSWTSCAAAWARTSAA